MQPTKQDPNKKGQDAHKGGSCSTQKPAAGSCSTHGGKPAQTSGGSCSTGGDKGKKGSCS